MTDYLLRQALCEISPAAEQAHKLGFIYAGYGRWKDKSGRVIAKTVKGSLVRLTGPASRRGPVPDLDQIFSDLNSDKSNLSPYTADKLAAHIQFGHRYIDKRLKLGDSPENALMRLYEYVLNNDTAPRIQWTALIDKHFSDYAKWMHHQYKKSGHAKIIADRRLQQFQKHHPSSVPVTMLNKENADINYNLLDAMWPESDIHDVSYTTTHGIQLRGYDALSQLWSQDITNQYDTWTAGHEDALRPAIDMWQNEPIYNQPVETRSKLYDAINDEVFQDTTNLPTVHGDQPLYRGMRMDIEVAQRLIRDMVRRPHIVLPPSGFTTDRRVAATFCRLSNDQTNKAAVSVRIFPKNKKIVGLHISKFGFFGEREVIRPGHMRHKIRSIQSFYNKASKCVYYYIDLEETGETDDGTMVVEQMWFKDLTDRMTFDDYAKLFGTSVNWRRNNG